MTYTFAAERRLVFVVQCGGLNRLVEFGERNANGVSVFNTTDANVATAIRRSSMSRRGVIKENTKEPEPALTAPSPVKPAAAARPKQAETVTPTEENRAGSVREYANFTLAREAIVREFGLKKSDVRNPTALARVAQQHGFTIKYLNAEK